MGILFWEEEDIAVRPATRSDEERSDELEIGNKESEYQCSYQCSY